MTHVLTLEEIDAALQYAETELSMSVEITNKALLRQKRWTNEVESLRNLKKNRLEEAAEQTTSAKENKPTSTPTGKTELPEAEVSAPEIQVTTATQQVSGMTAHEISHIDWIEKTVINSGNQGMTPPELLSLAGKEGQVMHRNYPYTALRNLVDAGRIRKDGSRYYKPDMQGGLPLAE